MHVVVERFIQGAPETVVVDAAGVGKSHIVFGKTGERCGVQGDAILGRVFTDR